MLQHSPTGDFEFTLASLHRTASTAMRTQRGRSVLMLVTAGLLWVAAMEFVNAAEGTDAAPTAASATELKGRLQFFEQEIRPLLVKHCYDCHGPEVAEGKLRLDTRQGWERGGERGPAIVPGDPSISLLMRVVTNRDGKLKMPPPETGDQLTPREIDALTTWIRQGAADPRTGERVVTDIDRAAQQHWAFQPLQVPALPADEHPLDHLIDEQLHAAQLTPTAPAPLPTLIRRITFDLTGLPPTAAQLATPQAELPRLIDELLASPRYGERWGRHWLDVARYSDAKDGVLMYGNDRIRPFAYTYRDYVIRAFNDDKPYDQFIREQLAADQLGLAPDSPDLAALGLLTLGRMFDSNRHDVIDDQIDVIGRGFLGLSLACARCHDHKFDPVPTADYYSLYGVFASSVEPYNRPRIGPIAPAGEPFEQEFSAKLQEIESQQATHYAEQLQIARQRTPDYLVQVATTEPDVQETSIFFLSLTVEQLRPQITKRWRQIIARRAFPDDPVFGPWADLMKEPVLRTEEWRARGVDSRIIDALAATPPTSPADVARIYGEVIRAAWLANSNEQDPLVALLISRSGPVWFPPTDVKFYLARQPGDAFRGNLGQLDAIAVKHRDAADRAMVVQDAEILVDPVIFQRGDPNARGTPVPRQFLGILSPGGRVPFSNGSGRLELANSIASPDNPLTARVWVNRVWLHHFGESLVENPADFGLQAKRPRQQRVLDFLADYLIKQQWRTKALHRLIVSSRAYQRASVIPANPTFAQQRQADASNEFYWRGNRRRLDLEQMRDSLLTISGELDTKMYGRPGEITDPANFRRTIYAFVERQNIPAMVQTFDFANADTSTSRRAMTTVPQQALFALNSPFMLSRADALATQITKATNGDQASAATVKTAFQLVYGRDPTPTEAEDCQAFLTSGSLNQLCQVLLMSNELMFID